MPRCPVCEALAATGPQCVVTDNDCFEWTGTGDEGDEFAVSPIIAVAANQMLTCTPGSGLLAIPAAAITDPPACRAFKTSSLSVANNTMTAVPLDQENYDTDTMHSKTVNTNRITFTTAGDYLVTFNATWNKNSTGVRQAQIRKNGTDILAFESKTTGQADLLVSHAITILDSFSATDYVEGMVLQTSGGSLQLLADHGSPTLEACRVAS